MLLKNAYIHTGSGDAFLGDLREENGLIAEIGEHIPGEGEDMTGMHILPGFIDALTVWGINGSATEIKNSSNDNEETSDPVNPELEIKYAFNGRAMSVEQLPAFGITAIGVAPTDVNIFGGQMSAYCTADGVNPFDMCIREGVGMRTSVCDTLKAVYGKRGVPPMTKMRIFEQLSSWLRRAREYDPPKGGLPDEKLMALKKVLDGSMPLFVSTDCSSDREKLFSILDGYDKIRTVLCNCPALEENERWFKRKNTSVLLGYDTVSFCPTKRENDSATLSMLASSGADIALCGMNLSYGRENLLWSGVTMMRAIHDSERALSARVLSMMTCLPARLLGIDGQRGCLKSGMSADYVVWSDDPLLTFNACVMRTVISGKTAYAKGDALKCYI